MKRALIPLAAAVASLALLAGTAEARTTATAVRGAGTVNAFGTAGTAASFTLYLNSVKTNTLVYRERGLSFRALSMANIRFNDHAVKFGGVALVNGKAAHYTAIVVSHPDTGQSIFKLDWSHGPSRGGTLTSGHVRITPVAASTP